MKFQLQQPAKGVQYPWIKILKNSQYGSFPGSIEDKLMSMQLTTRHFVRSGDHRRDTIRQQGTQVVIPIHHAAPLLQWCNEEITTDFFHEFFQGRVFFHFVDLPTAIYVKTAFG